jgi:Mn-containing catalase
VDESFNGSTGSGDEGETDIAGPWQSSFGLHPVESQMVGGKGLSIGAIDGIAGPEGRGKQDAGKKASTATKVETVDPKPVPQTDAQQTGKQATVGDEMAGIAASHGEERPTRSKKTSSGNGGHKR